MKVISTLILTLALFLNEKVATEQITAVFDGTSDGVYYFTAEDMTSYGFDEMEEDVATKFNLDDEQYVGETFEISFRIELRTDADEMEYEAFIITALDLVD
mgnify:CR=1 FL=1